MSSEELALKQGFIAGHMTANGAEILEVWSRDGHVTLRFKVNGADKYLHVPVNALPDEIPALAEKAEAFMSLHNFVEERS